MEQIKFKLEFSVDVDILKEVLEKRGFEPSISNMKKLLSIYKTRTYNANLKFFDDIPKDKEMLLIYGLKPMKKNQDFTK